MTIYRQGLAFLVVRGRSIVGVFDTEAKAREYVRRQGC
jgi:hypothetical protein